MDGINKLFNDAKVSIAKSMLESANQVTEYQTESSGDKNSSSENYSESGEDDTHRENTVTAKKIKIRKYTRPQTFRETFEEDGTYVKRHVQYQLPKGNRIYVVVEGGIKYNKLVAIYGNKIQFSPVDKRGEKYMEHVRKSNAAYQQRRRAKQVELANQNSEK